MAPRRWLLLAVSMVSLLILAYGGALISFSVPVTQEMETAGRLPEEISPAVGQRAIVVPSWDVPALPTFVQGDAAPDGIPGTILLVADENPDFPAQADNASVVRALAFVRVDAEGNVTPPVVNLTNLPVREGDNVTFRNLSLDVGTFGLSPGAAGFLVKGDAEDPAQIRFVPADRVVGAVQEYDTLGGILIIVFLGGMGFVAPLVFLVMTHRPSGRPGVGEVLCAECRGPMPAASDFCPRCGAWKKGTR